MRFPAFFSFTHQKQWLHFLAQCRILLLLSLLVCTLLAAGSAMAISLSAAVDSALRLSPTILAAEKQRLILEQQTKQALSGYLPTVDFTATVGNEQTNSPSTRSAGLGNASLPHRETRTSINQTLFDGFNVYNAVKKARAQQKSVDAAYHAVVQTVSMEAIEQFLEVQKQRELLEKIKKFAAVQTEFLEKIREWYHGGAGTVAEVWQTESRLALTRSSMATVESQLATAIDEFTLLFGFGPANLDKTPSLANHLPRTLEQALRQAIQHHPSLLGAQFNQKAAEASRAGARAGLWPTIQLSLEKSHTNNASGFDGETEITAAMVRMSYNLFRGGTDWARSQEFVRRQEQSAAQTQQTQQTVQKNVEKSWRVIQELRQRLASLQKHETVSKQVAEAYHEQFIADQRSLLDVLNAEKELFTARSNRVSGYYALSVEEYRLLANMGILGTAFTTPVEPTTTVATAVAVPPPAEPTAMETFLTLQNAWLTPSIPLLLYQAPHQQAIIVRELSKQTPLRILQIRDTWMQVQDPEGNQGWVTGLPNPSGQMQSGLFTFPEPASLTTSNPNRPNDEPPTTPQNGWLTPSTPVLLYPLPHWYATTEQHATMVRELPKQTPLRILQTRDNWLHVEDSEGHQGWITGLSNLGGQMQSGMFTFPEPLATANPD